MITANAPTPATLLTQGFVLPSRYQDIAHPSHLSLRQFSEPAQYIIKHRLPLVDIHKLSDDMPEIIALRVLDFLSSKQGYVRRKGRSFRTIEFYEKMLPQFVKTIASGQPLLLSANCLSPNFTNHKLCGKSPYPHMASYIALENLHKIADAIKLIYAPGIQFVLGFEGYVFQLIYFHNNQVLRNAKKVFEELNAIVHAHLHGNDAPNPVKIVDARWMIEQAFGSLDDFELAVAERAKTFSPDTVAVWQKWYETAVPSDYFPSEVERRHFIEEKSYWRAAVRSFHYNGGKLGKGFVGFSEEAIPFSPGGRRDDMLALQLVPENSYLPHQRAITFEPASRRWRMMAYDEIISSKVEVYAPRFVRNYSYPFYYEKLGVSSGA